MFIMVKNIIVSDSLATVMIQLHVELLINVWKIPGGAVHKSVNNLCITVLY